MNLRNAVIILGVLAAGLTTPTRAQGKADSTHHVIFGTIDSLSGSRLIIRTRTGDLVPVDAVAAITRSRSTVLFVGRVVEVLGTRNAAGVLHAESIQRAKSSPALWPPDR